MPIKYTTAQLDEAAILLALEAAVDWDPIDDEDDFALREGAIRYPAVLRPKPAFADEITF